MKKPLMMIIAFFMATTLFLACDKGEDNDASLAVNQIDVRFANLAALGNSAEIDAGLLAVMKAQSDTVVKFGQMMVDDHTAAQSQLKSIATNLGLYAPDSLDAAHVAMLAQLSTLSGRAFDSSYLHEQVNDHKATIKVFQDVIDAGRHQDLRLYASTLLPVIKEHLRIADSIATADY